MSEITIQMKSMSELADMVNEFEKDYLRKMLEVRDQMWHKRNGVFKDEKEQEVYDIHRLKCEFLQNMVILMRQLLSFVAVSENAMQDFLSTLERMKITPEGNFRSTLFTEQTNELNRITDKIKRIYNA